MAENSNIGWCDHTHNFWIGCQQVSRACDFCYAMVLNRRHKWVGDGEWNGKERYETKTCKLKSWDKQATAFYAEHERPQRVFINSLSDFFDNQVPPAFRERAWAKIRDNCKHMIVMLLTKRPQNIHKMLPSFWDEIKHRVWIGTTVENQEEADRRIPHLVKVDADVLFLSCEPLLGALDLRKWLDKIKWVIAGGESGPNFRAPIPKWILDLWGQCLRAKVAFFFKQWGGVTPKAGGDMLGGQRVQEFPNT